MTIKINCMSPPARQKFTLAHELAHLILRPGHAKTARRCVSSSDLEDACDILAAELLMPLAEVKNSTSGIGSIEDLLTLARRFGSSLNATAIRVKEVAGWKESIGLWKWHGFATELWYVGKRLWPERHVDLSIFEMALRTSRTLRSSEEVNGQSIGVYRVNSQVRHLGNNHLLGLLERG
ncbi:MAG: ImmA/IrrE family metallo-endopeptidase [Terriglobia bacterium]